MHKKLTIKHYFNIITINFYDIKALTIKVNCDETLFQLQLIYLI